MDFDKRPSSISDKKRGNKGRNISSFHIVNEEYSVALNILPVALSLSFILRSKVVVLYEGIINKVITEKILSVGDAI